MHSLRLGAFGIRICADNSITSLLPRSFWKYEMSDINLDCPEVSLFVADIPLSINNQHSSDWIYEKKGSRHQATYFRSKSALFSIEYGHDLQSLDVVISKHNRQGLSIGIQYASLLALSSRCVGLHGVTVICGDQAIILSAPSGTGKTTLAQLLQKYCETAVINGDFALLNCDGESVFFEPTPFCGSSGICLNYRLKVDRIVFLEQSAENKWYSLTPRQSLCHMMCNTFIPEWDSTLSLNTHSQIADIVNSIPMHVFSFEPSQAAAEFFQNMVSL